MKDFVFTDAFLPHLVDLATKSSDRQTKVAACELLHSLIIYCLGRSAQQPGARVERASMAGLYMKLFPAMLKLSCDVEQVIILVFLYSSLLDCPFSAWVLVHRCNLSYGGVKRLFYNNFLLLMKQNVWVLVRITLQR